MSRTPRLFRPVITISLVLAGIFILLSSWMTYRKIANDMRTQSRQVLINRVLLIHESISSVIEEASGRLHTIMSYMADNYHLSDFDKISVDRVKYTIPQCRKLWIVKNDGTIVTDSGTGREYLDQPGWWTPYMETAQLPEGVPSSPQFEIVINTEHPFRDAMNLSTYYPIVFYLLSGSQVHSMAFAEIDLTYILMNRIRDFHLNLIDKAYPLEFSLYDRSGMLLESSLNIPKFSVPVLNTVKDPLNISFEDERFLQGFMFRQDGEKLSIITRDSELGLIFKGSLHSRYIIQSAGKAAVYILFIGLFCISVVLILGVLLLKTYHKMKQYEDEQAAARFRSLQNKMNPHFLFNTLDSLVGVTEKRDYPVLIQMLKSLSYILHMNIRIRQDIISLSDEIQYLESYLSLCSIRYKDVFSYELLQIDNAGDFEVLRFCLQPLLENCFVHSVSHNTGNTHIQVEMKENETDLIVEIRDNGAGVTEDKKQELIYKLQTQWKEESSPRLGLMSIHRRLRILYGEPYGLELLNQSRGFGVRVRFPVLK